MSLNSHRLPSVYHSGEVFMPVNDNRAIPFIQFITLSVVSGQGEAILSSFEYMYSKDSEVLLLSTIGDARTRARMLISYVSRELQTNPEDLTAYIMFATDTSDSEHKCEKVVVDIPKDRFFVLVASEGVCIIVANAKNVNIASSVGNLGSMDLQRILKSGKGYHTYCEGHSPVSTFANILERESIELSNTSIYAYLSENYNAIADMHIPFKSEISEELCRYFNSRIIDILSKEHGCDFGLMPCCWSCSSASSVENYYIKPFTNMSHDICEIHFKGSMLPVCDLGSQGCLLVADAIEVLSMINEITLSGKTSVFDKGAEDPIAVKVTGLPVEEPDLYLAVTYADFIRVTNRTPCDSDMSKKYKGLYLLKDIPKVPVLRKCLNAKYVYTFEYDDFGFRSITKTDTPVVYR